MVDDQSVFHGLSSRSRNVAMATNFGVKSTKLAYFTFTRLTSVPKLSEYHKADFRRSNGNDSSILFRNLVRFGIGLVAHGIYDVKMCTAGVVINTRVSLITFARWRQC